MIEQSAIGHEISHNTMPSAANTAPALPGIPALIEESWQVFKKQFPTLVSLEVLSVLTPVAGAILITLMLFLSTLFGKHPASKFAYNAGVQALNSNTAINISVIVIGLVILLLIIWLAVRYQIALILAIKNWHEGIKIGEAFRGSKGKALSYIWIGALCALCVIGATTLFIIPGIIFAVLLSFINFVFVAEGVTGLEALLRSKTYIKGRWWKIFGMQLFIIIPIYFINLISIILNALGWRLAALVFLALMALFLAPFILIYQFKLYEGAKASSALDLATQSKKSLVGLSILGAVEIIALALLAISIVYFLPTHFQSRPSLPIRAKPFTNGI